jgi:hypothetical protein
METSAAAGEGCVLCRGAVGWRRFELVRMFRTVYVERHISTATTSRVLNPVETRKLVLFRPLIPSFRMSVVF